MARLGPERLTRRMLGAVREESGRAGHGNRGASLLGCFGVEGSLLMHLRRHLTPAARALYFGDVAGGKRAGTEAWHALAQHKEKWRKFVNSVKN